MLLTLFMPVDGRQLDTKSNSTYTLPVTAYTRYNISNKKYGFECQPGLGVHQLIQECRCVRMCMRVCVSLHGAPSSYHHQARRTTRRRITAAKGTTATTPSARTATVTSWQMLCNHAIAMCWPLDWCMSCVWWEGLAGHPELGWPIRGPSGSPLFHCLGYLLALPPPPPGCLDARDPFSHCLQSIVRVRPRPRISIQSFHRLAWALLSVVTSLFNLILKGFNVSLWIPWYGTW